MSRDSSGATDYERIEGMTMMHSFERPSAHRRAGRAPGGARAVAARAIGAAAVGLLVVGLASGCTLTIREAGTSGEPPAGAGSAPDSPSTTPM